MSATGTFSAEQVLDASRDAQICEMVPLWADICDIADAICPGWRNMSKTVRTAVTAQAQRAWYVAAPKLAARVTHAQVEALGLDWRLVEATPDVQRSSTKLPASEL